MSFRLSYSSGPRLFFRLHRDPRHPIPSLHRHLSTGRDGLSQLESEPVDEASIVSKIVQNLKQTPEQDWGSSEILNSLLFSPPASSSPRFFSRIVRNLPAFSLAFAFVDYLQHKSPSPPDNESLSIAFQSVLEIASSESGNSNGRPQRCRKLLELYNASKEKNIGLTVNAAKLLIRVLGKDKMVDESIMVYEELEPGMQNTHVRNVLIDVLFGNGRVDNALKVLDGMLGPNSDFPPDNMTGDIVFRALLRKDPKGRRVSEEEIIELVSKFRGHGVFPGNFWLTQLVTLMCKNDQIDRAWDVLEQQMKHNARLEVVCCNALLSGLGRRGDVDKMNQLLRNMKELDVRPDQVTFGIIINNLCKLRRVDEALEIVEKMQDGKDGIVVEPDVITYNTLIDGFCKAGRLEEARDLVETMKKQKCAPNTVTYNCLIDGFCRAGQIEVANSLFHQMKDEGIKPNVVTLNTMLGGMCRHGRLHSAVEFFNANQGEGLKGNVVTYTTLINGFSNANNVDKGMEFFSKMLEAGCSPDAKVYHALISGLCQAGRLNDASAVASKLKEAGFGLDLVGYNMLISGFCRQKKLDKLRETLIDMEEAGVKADTITYNTLISFFSKIGDFNSAHMTMKKMIEEGLVPTVVTYGALIHAYCVHGDIKEAMKIYRDMSSRSKVTPNTVIYNILIDSLCKNNDVDCALSLMADMRVKGVRPNTNTFNAMFKGLKEKNQLEKALELMDKMTEYSCAPDYVTMEILQEWLPAVGETKKLKRFVQGYAVSTKKQGIAI